MKIEEKNKKMNLELPQPSKPVGSYVPVMISGNTVYTSGIIPVENGGDK